MRLRINGEFVVGVVAVILGLIAIVIAVPGSGMVGSSAPGLASNANVPAKRRGKRRS